MSSWNLSVVSSLTLLLRPFPPLSSKYFISAVLMHWWSTKEAPSWLSLLSDRHSGGSRHQRPVVSHRGAACHRELLRQLSLPLRPSNPPLDFGERVERLRGSEGWGSDSPLRPPQANITFLPVLHRHSPGETQDQVRSAPPGSQSTGHCKHSAHHMWAKAWFCQFSYICWVWHTKMSVSFFFPSSHHL